MARITITLNDNIMTAIEALKEQGWAKSTSAVLAKMAGIVTGVIEDENYKGKRFIGGEWVEGAKLAEMQELEALKHPKWDRIEKAEWDERVKYGADPAKLLLDFQEGRAKQAFLNTHQQHLSRPEESKYIEWRAAQAGRIVRRMLFQNKTRTQVIAEDDIFSSLANSDSIHLKGETK